MLTANHEQAANVLQVKPTYDANLFVPLKIVTDIVPGLRHNDAMRTIERRSHLLGFGHVTTISYSYQMPNGGVKYQTTYLLTKRQSFIYAADASPVGASPII